MPTRLPFLIAALGIVGFGLVALLSPSAQAETTVNSGDLIRGETFSAVYYMGEDGFRYVFPNDKTFFTWYSDFDDVKWISDAELASIQIGGNVTYKPGVKMIKINTDPKVYYVDEGGELRWVADEDQAFLLYGSDWNRNIDDVPDGFFSNYSISDSSAPDWILDLDTDYSINDDKYLNAPVEISITDAGFSPADVNVELGQTVRFTNNGNTKHTATADDGSWGTGTLNPGESFVKRLSTAGDIAYYCSYHSSMTGALEVIEVFAE